MAPLKSLAVVGVAGMALAACTGLIGEPGSRPGRTADGGRPPPGVPPDLRPGTMCEATLPAPAPTLLMTRVEYDNTVRDLLGDTTQPASAFGEDTYATVF